MEDLEKQFIEEIMTSGRFNGKEASELDHAAAAAHRKPIVFQKPFIVAQEEKESEGILIGLLVENMKNKWLL